MKLFLSVLIVFSFSGLIHSQPRPEATDWKLRKNENGIQVYSRHEPGISIDNIKIVSEANASLSAVAALLLDVENYKSWIFRCNESKLLKQISATEQFQYQKNDAPYPVSDRDIPVHFTIWQNSKTKVVYTRSIGVPDYIEAFSGIVRMPSFDGGYIITPLGNGKVQIIYTLSLDPGGSLPAWLINWTIVTGPYESTLKMQEELQKPKYKNSKLSFITEP